MQKIEGTLLYVCLAEPVAAYVAAGEAAKPKEWKASIAVADEDKVDEFEAYAKSIDAKVSVKKVKTAEFEGIYKCPAPEDAGKNVWVLTFRKSTELGKTGKPVPEQYRPRVFEQQGKAIVDVTKQKLPANGSKGVISLEVFERSNNTSSLYLKNVLVTEMIEYVRQDSDYTPGSEFGEPESEAAEKPAAKAKEETKAKPAARKPAKTDEDSDAPF